MVLGTRRKNTVERSTWDSVKVLVVGLHEKVEQSNLSYHLYQARQPTGNSKAIQVSQG